MSDLGHKVRSVLGGRGEWAAPFEVIIVRRSGVTVVAVVGDLDIVTSRRLRGTLTDAAGDVVIDLTWCGFIDSTGLAVILNATLDTGARVTGQSGTPQSGGAAAVGTRPSGAITTTPTQ